jgi:uncharacterized repeat protein (TIGR03803 family)
MKRAVIVVVGVCLIVGSHLRAQSSFEVIHTFSGNQGRPVAGLVEGPDGLLYGTTEAGGQHGMGSVFVTDASGLDARVLHNFSGGDGVGPLGRLLLASNGRFYGTTSGGGESGLGTVFEITADGAFSTVAAFNDTNGAVPLSGLIEVDGQLYGTTIGGGASGSGTVFRVALDGSALTSFSFDGVTGASPMGTLLRRADSIYGTAQGGGANGHGAIFRLLADGTLEAFASFDAATTGQAPRDGIIEGSDGNFYGTTPGDAATTFGTVFSMTPGGELSTVVTFDFANGATPMGGLSAFNGALYGTTRDGGDMGNGTVFRVSLGDVPSFESLWSFGFFDGANPRGGVIQASSGSIFGTASNGGDGGLGSVFHLSESPSSVATILSFAGLEGGSTPSGRLLQATDGNFYGTTLGGGAFGLGTVFKLTPDGLMTTLVSFDGGNGLSPSGGLVQLGNALYGTTEQGGFGDGDVFSIDLTSGELTTIAIFDSFAEVDPTGAGPRGGLTIGSDGNLYGTTEFGSITSGTVFKVTPGGELTTLASFDGFPTSGVVQGFDGALYGATEEGGDFGAGAIFRVALPGGEMSTFASFDVTNGAFPTARPIVGEDGTLYGTTAFGGAADQGTAYQVSADGAVSVLASFDGIDPAGPFPQSLLRASDGNLYGAASLGGFGVVYQLDGGSILPIHTFDGVQGSGPNSALVESFDGSLYGTTQGPQGGTIFRITFEDAGDASLELAPASGTYGGLATLSATLSSSAGPMAGAQIDFSLNGMSFPAITDDAGVATVSVSVAGLDAGSYPGAITATSAAAPGVIASADLTIDKAVPTISVVGGEFVYDTEPHAASATVAGVTGEDLGAAAITYNGSPDAPIDPRAYLVVASYAGSLNYEAATAEGTLTILPAPPGVTGLIAAYGFNEGGGNIAADSSGRNHDGVIRGANWVAGRFGKALSFDGSRDWVTVADHSDLDVRNGVTMMAWVNPRELSGWDTIAMKETRSSLAYALFANDAGSRAAGYVNIAGEYKSVTSVGALPLNSWSHIAVTYSGTTLRFYLNGVEVNRRSVSGRIVVGSGELRIGGNSVWDDRFFNGLIDEVRIYGSAISPADIQRDMTMPVAHEFEAPTVSIASPLDGAVVSGMPRITASASDNVAVASVQFEVDGKMIAKSIADDPYTMRLDAANGDHVIRALARDTAGNMAWSAPVTIRIANRRVADFRFNEAGGSVAMDGSGMGNSGTMSAGVTRATDAERGKVLQFNGLGGIVAVPDSDSLDLQGSLTLEAWVKPSALLGWRTVMFKEGDGLLPRYVLNANDFTPTPAAYLHIDFVPDGIRSEQTLPLNEWTHLAVTYDGEAIRLFVNGEEKESRSESGAVRISEGRLLIGGTPWGQWFRGRMDDVRIYDVAVAAAQIKADMKEAIE